MNLSTRLYTLFTLFQISVGRSWDILIIDGSYTPLNRDFLSILKDIGSDIIGERPFEPIPDDFWSQIHRANAPQIRVINHFSLLIPILSLIPVLAYNIAAWLLTTFILAPLIIAEFILERPIVAFIRFFIGPATYAQPPLPIPRGVNSPTTENAWEVQKNSAASAMVHPPLFNHAKVTNQAVIEVKKNKYFNALPQEIRAYVDTFADKTNIHSLLDEDEREALIKQETEDYRCPILCDLPQIPVKLGKKTYDLNMLLVCIETPRGFIDPYTRGEIILADIHLPDRHLMDKISEALQAKASFIAGSDENTSLHLS
jgi:hypothetical protein